MPEDEKELLKRSVELAEENNDMLRAIRRSMRLARFISIMYWVFIIGSAVGAYYLIQETNQALAMPLLDFKLSATKTQILREAASGNKKVSNIIKKTKKSKAMVYAHINQLKKEGYLTEDMEITDAGRICVL